MNKLLKNREEEFNEDFKCIQHGCDNNGSISVMGSDGEQEQEQCQYCDEYKFKQKNFNKQTTLALLEGMVSMVKERQRGWYGSEEDGSDRHPNFDEDQYFLDYLQEQITEIKK